ncbi:MAG: SDR family NAD(P)-dependent oxidoreductase [Phycisphaerales bacterium]|nr:MAG: SDR family NAD(P)-dependent oxidoreductase [Phycisphaerales bacterium]
MSFEGRHVVVTGGGGSLGCAVVTKLLGAGAICHVPLAEARPPDRHPALDDPRCRFQPGVDLTDETAVVSFYEGVGRKAEQAQSRLWASVHCAGGFAMGPAMETSLADFDAQLRMNLATAFLCSREAGKLVRKAGGGGRIVNVAARPALFGELGKGMVSYAVSKAGVAALTQALAAEWAEHELWVNAVVPSIMDTPGNRKAMPDADHGQWPSVADIAETVVFLASPWNLSTRAALVPVYGRS